MTVLQSFPDIAHTRPQKLLGITIDRRVNFYDHVSNIYNKASAKISAMAKVFPFMLLNQRKLIKKAKLF